jgi:hypothetical protein
MSNAPPQVQLPGHPRNPADAKPASNEKVRPVSSSKPNTLKKPTATNPQPKDVSALPKETPTLSQVEEEHTNKQRYDFKYLMSIVNQEEVKR